MKKFEFWTKSEKLTKKENIEKKIWSILGDDIETKARSKNIPLPRVLSDLSYIMWMIKVDGENVLKDADFPIYLDEHDIDFIGGVLSADHIRELWRLSGLLETKSR